jgi:zinc-binding alcohol dehydrogenase/oxidoreductase
LKAAVLAAVGGPLQIEERPDPSRKKGEALVSLRAAAFNRRDHWISIGAYPSLTLPAVLGSDGCGWVEEGPPEWVGKEVVICPSIGWGDRECAPAEGFQILGMPGDGTFAQRISVPAGNLCLKPDHLDPAEAAALPLAGLTAWRAVHTKAQLRPGERVLVTGAGGGVALAALQFALEMGAEAYVTSSCSIKIGRAVELGAAGGVRYDRPGWRKKLPGDFDVVIDSAGGQDFGELVRLLGQAGRLVFYGGTQGAWPQILPQHLFFRQISLLGSTMGSPREFAEMCTFVGEKKIRPSVDSLFPLDRPQAGMDRLMAGDRFGKVVLETAR